MAKKDILLNGIIVDSYEPSDNIEKDIEIIQNILKKKGLYKTITVNDAMYSQANSFTKIAEEIYQKDLKKSPYNVASLPPFVVNAVLGIEIYLKTIHNAFGNAIKGHNLKKIYENMGKEGQEIFISASQDIRPLYKLEQNTDISSCLSSLSNAFEKWRYLYESNQMKTEIQSIRYTMHTSYEACCRVRESILLKKHNKT